jgi:hypothetical protein
MGAVFRSKDIGRGYKKIIENSIKDLSPDTKEYRIALKEILKASLTFD